MKKFLLVIALVLSHFTYARIGDSTTTTPPATTIDSTTTIAACNACCETNRAKLDSVILVWYTECNKKRLTGGCKFCFTTDSDCSSPFSKLKDSLEITYKSCIESCKNKPHVTFVEFKSDNSINSNEGNYNISIYPIPAQHKLFIQTNTDLSGDVSVSIVNLIGAVVKQIPIPHEEGKLIFELNIEDLSSGLYFINVMGENINHQSKVIISN